MAMETKARKAFLAAIQDIRDRATLRRIRDALAAGNVEAAIRAVGVESAAFQAFQAAIVEAYTASGAMQVNSMVWRDPGMNKVVVRWDFDNPSARMWLEDLSSTRITGNLVQQQISLIRTTISEGFSLGRGPSDIARDIIGRIGANGSRQGGIIGLTDQQGQFVRNMRYYLENDPSRALQMTRRDRRFDKLIKSGKPLTKEQINRAVTSYENKMLALRGETIARTEVANAVSAARYEATRQGIEKSGIDPRFVVKKWFHSGPAANGAERDDHAALNRTEVQGLDTPFMVGGYIAMQYPHDPNAPVEQLANCRCSYTISVDYSKLAV